MQSQSEDEPRNNWAEAETHPREQDSLRRFIVLPLNYDDLEKRALIYKKTLRI